MESVTFVNDLAKFLGNQMGRRNQAASDDVLKEITRSGLKRD
ncbi:MULTISPECIES: hypothetical protein [unclassified Sporolactobacillus]|nr:hypothetical protein [Sporolactobacillus sp. CQH2019]MDD9149518.1 hypothetical protein [Sporolactobacillus sp. CQH2019]